MAREHKKQVTVLLEHQEDRRFSAYCEEKGYKKSTLIAGFVREHLDKEASRHE
ncbi:hypothetical protein [Paenirhodobacter populi]|uniref:hypothetical protein n=1 Tax=Paenirhodobacter populi TaxID=2306993 RepID=UPI0013E3C9B9|nr:hypothetical protein [Sinirhodobacter populi]